MSVNNTQITFCGITLPRIKIGSRLPVPQPKSRMKEHFMTEGSGGPGIRVLEPLGVHMSYADITFTGQLLSASNITTFFNAFMDQRTPRSLVIYNPVAGSATYSVLFAADGFTYDLMDDLSDYDDYVPPYQATFNLHILARTS